jgi:hypothetical protein
VSRSVAMKLTGHKTESVYRRHAIVSEGDLSDGVSKLARLYGQERGSSQGKADRHTIATPPAPQPWEMRRQVASPTGFEPVPPP